MRARTGCQACRDRHIKCVRRPDSAKCEKCFETNRECFNNSVHRFKPVKSVSLKNKDGQKSHKTLTHDATQVWVDVPSRVDFVGDGGYVDDDVDEEEGTAKVTSRHHNHTDIAIANSHARTETWRTPLDPALPSTVPMTSIAGDLAFSTANPPTNGCFSTDLHYPDNSPQHSRSYSGTRHITSPNVHIESYTVLNRTDSHRTGNHSSPGGFAASPHSSMRPGILSATPTNLNSPAYSLSTTWPFQNPREAMLFYHYIKHISPWIDVLDAYSYFGREIPRRAAYQPLIANAIYALASLQLSLLKDTEDKESPQYVDGSLQHLKVILDDPLGHADENLLAGVILLRSHEEMSDKDENVHLLGGKRLLNSIASYAADGGFKESASWISLRQHIYISLTTQSPLGLNLSNYEHSSVFIDQSDEAWANRAVFLFACVLNYVFGTEEESHTRKLDTNRWTELEAQVEAWNTSKPWYFSALWSQAPRERTKPWPELLTSEPAHAVGLQYYSLCKIVLAIYDPRLSRLGFGTLKLRKASENTVVEHLRISIGLAVSNPDVTNAMFQGSHILATCGSYLHDPVDQDAAIDFLEGMHRSMGWRTRPIIETLKEQWAG